MTLSIFKGKISNKRPYNYKSSQNTKENDLYSFIKSFESDRGRVINSAAIRRLQQKTQVFPLERNSFVRTRLTHSLEVQQAGRYIAKEIFQRLNEKALLTKWELEQAQIPFESLVEIACLMHDIGNPPFGHFGESAISEWFLHYFKTQSSVLKQAYTTQETAELCEKMIEDLCHFEGNAQAIRLVYSLLNLNLTYSQTASILKYTRPAYMSRDKAVQQHKEYDYLLKKPGYYLSEEKFVHSLYQHLNMTEFARYPLTYIMEAADDIAYCLADLEDAVEKKLFTIDQLYDYLEQCWGEVIKGDLFYRVVRFAYDKHKKLKEQVHVHDQEDFFFRNLRIMSMTQLVSCAAERFIENLTDIFNGTFNEALLDGQNAEVRLLEVFKTVSREHVFTHESVGMLELQGSRIMKGLLDIYGILLALSADDMAQLMQKNILKAHPSESHLFRKLPRKHLSAYQDALTNLDAGQKMQYEYWEFYYRCRLLQDYISGMTDLYAYDEYRKLMIAG